ncbi:MAG: Gfo/Idh/MocA family protein [Opitutales bacterium]
MNSQTHTSPAGAMRSSPSTGSELPSAVSRRKFLTTGALATAGLTILPSGTLFGRGANSKLNIALIGAHGRGSQLYQGIRSENVVALCDVNASNLAQAKEAFPHAKTYVDWRKCLDQKDIDAVVCATPDATHAFIATWAMNRGYHVYMEKPLGNCVYEARMVRDCYLKNRHKLATQHGTQNHALHNNQRVVELIRRGAIGELRHVHTWGNRTHSVTDYHPAEGTQPDHLNWDLWLGPSPERPYSPRYFGGKPGTNCLRWNMFRDYGSWQVGDMGSHVMDFAWNAIDADRPTKISATGDDFNPSVCPSRLRAVFDMPANDWRGEIRLVWHQGGLKPNNPHDSVNLGKIGHGMMYVGTRGILVSDFRTRLIIPSGADANMTYYDAPSSEEDLLPETGNFMEQWMRAAKGDLKTNCDFDYAGRMIETLMLGLVAHEAGQELEYDATAGRITNMAAANSTTYFKRTYRPGWELNG